MARIEQGTLRNWNNGETMLESDYEQEREILRVANNDNFERIVGNTSDISSLKTRANDLETRSTNLETRATDLESRSTNVEGRATTLESRATTLESGKADKTSVYDKGESNNLLALKTDKTGDHLGTWRGLTPGQASEAINGGRLDVVEAKITQAEAQNLTLVRGSSSYNVLAKSPVSGISFTGKTVINLVPLFDSGLWGTNAQASVISGNELKVTANGTTVTIQSDYLSIKPNTNFRFSNNIVGVVAGKTYIDATVYDSNKVALQSDFDPTTFTSGATVAFIRLRLVVLNTVANGTLISFKDLMLNEGTTAQEFVANVKGVTNPTIENKTTGESITLMGTFHEGDTVSEVDGQYRANRKWKEMVLDGSLPWTIGADYTGFKIISVQNYLKDIAPSTSFPDGVKYNGKILNKTTNAIDSCWVDTSVGTLFIGISDTDSGWGETYTPTADEIKAYFLKWKMNNGTFGTPYDGTGTKTWTKLNATSNTGSVTVLPTTEADGIDSYRLIYQLATPVDEAIPHIGNVTLQSGDNTIEVTEGRIVRERANPVVHTDNVVRINDIYSTSYTKYKTDNIMNVYKNGVIDNSWTIENNLSVPVNGKAVAYITNLSNFDPSAVYEVDYIPSEPYKVTAQTPSISAKYQTNLGSVVSSLVNDVADVEKRTDVIENSMVRKNTPANWIKPILVNGWLNYGGSRALTSYAKDDLKTVRIKGAVKTGTVGTTIFILPVGYRPKEDMFFMGRTWNGSSVTLSTIVVYSYGDVKLTDGSNVEVSLDMISFKAEQ